MRPYAKKNNSSSQRGRATGPARIPVSGQRTATAAIGQRNGQAPPSGSPGPSGLAAWSPLQKGLAAAGLVGVVAAGVLYFTSGTAMAAEPPRLPGTQPPRLPGGGGGGSSPSSTASPGGGGGGAVNRSEANLTADGIRGIQRTLRGLGYGAAPYNVSCSGAIDSATRSAVRAFQRAYAPDAANHADWVPRTLKVDGIIGRETQSALTHYSAYYDRGSC